MSEKPLSIPLSQKKNHTKNDYRFGVKIYLEPFFYSNAIATFEPNPKQDNHEIFYLFYFNHFHKLNCCGTIHHSRHRGELDLK